MAIFNPKDFMSGNPSVELRDHIQWFVMLEDAHIRVILSTDSNQELPSGSDRMRQANRFDKKD